jgi:hypothetical protein
MNTTFNLFDLTIILYAYSFLFGFSTTTPTPSYTRMDPDVPFRVDHIRLGEFHYMGDMEKDTVGVESIG